MRCDIIYIIPYACKLMNIEQSVIYIQNFLVKKGNPSFNKVTNDTIKRMEIKENNRAKSLFSIGMKRFKCF